MFEWDAMAGRMASGEAAPLDAVPALAGLSDQALLELDQDEALAVIELAQAGLAALAAVQAVAVEAFTRREQEDTDRFRADQLSRGHCALGIKDADETVPVMLAPVFHVAPRTMHSTLFELRTLVNDLPVTLGMVRAGRLEASRARSIADQAGCVDRGYLGDFERELHAKDITSMAHAAVRARAAAAAVRVDPASAAHRAADARRDREVRVRPGEPGMSDWYASQPAETSVRAWAAIEALAAQYAAGNPALNIGQARADAMMDLILGRATITAIVDMVIPIPDIHDRDSDSNPSGSPDGGAQDRGAQDRGTQDRGTQDRSGQDRGAQDRVGPAVGRTDAPGSADRDRADAARALIPQALRVSFGDLMHRLMAGQCSAGAVHRRVGIVLNEHLTTLLADPDTIIRIHGADPDTGTLTRHDPSTYRPGAALARAVRARDGTCRMPGCATPAERCQLDHVTPFPHGPTQISNLASLCTAHHGFKHHAGWHLSMTPDGVCTWTSPLHRTYTTHPQDHRDLAA